MTSCARSSRAWLAVFLLAAATATAQTPDLHVHGFVSQGWLNTRHNNYLVDDSRDGTAEFNEAAVSLQMRPSDRLRIGAQFLARDFGATGNGVVRLDWAYGDYRWRDWLHVRAGKIKTMMGLYGEARDVDFLRTTVLLPQAVYPELHRDFIVGVEGIGIHGNIPLSDVGGIDYDVWAGTLDVNDAEHGFWGDTFTDTGLALATLLSDVLDTDVRYLGSSDEHVRFRYMTGGSAFWNSPLTGFRAGGSIMTGRFDATGRDEFSLAVTTPGDPIGRRFYTLDNSYGGKLDYLVFLSAEWNRGSWLLAAEYYQERIDDQSAEGYYVQLTDQVCDRLSLSTYAGRALRNRRDADGRQMEAEGWPRYLAWQNDYCLAARIDLEEQWALKAEYHVVDGLGQLSLAKNQIGDTDAWRRWWSYVAVKATFHF